MKIFIVGGSSGIGLSLAKRYANLGNEVAICGTNEDKLKKIANKNILSGSGNVEFIQGSQIIKADKIKVKKSIFEKLEEQKQKLEKLKETLPPEEYSFVKWCYSEFEIGTGEVSDEIDKPFKSKLIYTVSGFDYKLEEKL